MIKIAIFSTFDYSLKTWSDSGVLEKELTIYKETASNHQVKFTFYTYGDEDDYQFSEQMEDFEIIPISVKVKPISR